MDDYSLDAVAREVLGEGKAVAGDVRDRVAEIIHNYRHDLPSFALYARTDARLAYQIVEKLNLIRLSFARSQLTGMTPDRVAASIASFDFLYLEELQRVHVVAPSVRGNDSRVHAAQQGGHVLERSPACIAMSGYSISRACTPASSAPSTLTRSALRRTLRRTPT